MKTSTFNWMRAVRGSQCSCSNMNVEIWENRGRRAISLAAALRTDCRGERRTYIYVCVCVYIYIYTCNMHIILYRLYRPRPRAIYYRNRRLCLGLYVRIYIKGMVTRQNIV